MLVDAALTTTDLHAVPDAARGIEAAGYDGIYSFEGAHDGFFPLLLAAEHTERVQLTTAVVIAFARNPMTLAQSAYDLQLASRGRFNLGLGTQIKPHIEKRFSMEWSKPVERMRELVLAVRAIWARWHEGTRLDFHGDFYTHTLMTPFFDPGPNPFGVPRIFLGGVGPRMTEVAGEVADGFMIHPFSTEKFMRETTMPALERGLHKSGRTHAQLEVAFPAMVIVSESDEELARGRDAMRARSRRDAPAARVLRLDARVQGRTRRPWLGRAAIGAQPAVEVRRLDDDGGADHRRDRRHVRGVGDAGTDRPAPARSLRRSRAARVVRHPRTPRTRTGRARAGGIPGRLNRDSER
jgi:probable F420-dependent oxidoreductase